jgi:hypothetical protein
MANANGSSAPPVKTFNLGGEAFTAAKLHRCWTLTLDARVVETHDLSRGIDELLGKSYRNRALVLEILEWQAGMQGA